ncbi:hypothetical protein HII31_01694 [Pseudocercospora fuligena]|uniref:Uncharacterized protein n=1 Tax=Pseudocercospora fuligena TaxID=685502 RepID=A0A8H6VQN5_9PEZI|nr:hypothetical protein HII31_01694 [Pseudocercospora fuligena]
MQFKYIVAAIATSAVSGTFASPAPNDVEEMRALVARADMKAYEEAVTLGEQTKAVTQQLFDKYGHALNEAYETNFKKNSNAKIPTEQEMLEMKQKIDDLKKNGNQNTKRDPLDIGLGLGVGIGIGGGGIGLGVGIGAQIGWNYPNGVQCNYPFLNYPHIYDYNIANYYTCNGLYTGCSYGYC